MPYFTGLGTVQLKMLEVDGILIEYEETLQREDLTINTRAAAVQYRIVSSVRVKYECN